MSVPSFAWVRSVQKTIACLLLGVGLAALPACGGGGGSKAVITTKPCTLNSDCNTGLVCSFGLCHSECKDTADCPAGERCISGGATASGDAGTDAGAAVASMTTNVCQLPVETQCHFNSDCQDPLVCAVDRQCRDQCVMDRDCITGQVCANGGVCAEPTEVTSTGALKGAVDAGTGDSGNGEAGASGTDSGSDAGPDAGGNCNAGASCVPTANACDTGTVSCASGSPVCVDSGTAASDGTACGTDKVCSVGACVACKANDVCQPDPNNACATGKLSCTAGPVCTANGNTADGTTCGTGQVCSVGVCTACVDGTVCTPVEPCKAGAMTCETGPTCVAGANLTAGTTCDTNKVCDSTANCTECVQDGACTPSTNDCHAGKYDCTTGPNCVDQGANAQNGVTCGTQANSFCSAGTCAACLNGNPCIPTNACHTGTLNCATTPATCNDTQTAVTDGVNCGTNESCLQGVCHTNDRTLTVTAGGGGSFVVDSTFTAVTVHLVDANNAAVAGAAVTVDATSGGYGVASVTTNASGNANVTGRVGRLVGQVYTYTVSAPGATPITFKETATAATTGNIYTIENVTHTSGPGNSPVTPIPGTVAQTYYQIYAAVAATDGTVYFADYCNVYLLSTLGEVTRIAGKGGTSCGSALGDGGPGPVAQLSEVYALALDQPNSVLYIADVGNNRVRQLDLTVGQPNSGTITTYAGGGVNQTPYGDGGPATGAYVNPQGLSVAPNGDLYISDSNTSHIRKVAAADGTITTYRSGGSCTPTLPLTLYTCNGYGDSCSVAWDSAGHAFIAGYFCGGSLPSYVAGVARVEADNSLTLVAGAYSGGTGENLQATASTFASTPSIAFDAAGNLYTTVRNAHKIRRIDSVTTKVTTVAGDGTPSPTVASVTDYVAATDVPATTAAELNYPNNISFDSSGNLYFADTNNYSVRVIATVGNSVAGTAKLATQAGTGNTVSVDASSPVMQVKLTDGSNLPIPNVPVKWARVDPGSGFVGASANNFTSIVQSTGSAGALNGVSGEPGRVGLASPGPYHFTASYNDIHGTPVTGSPQTISVASQAPAVGTIFPIVNYAHTSGHLPLPAPAVLSEIDYPQAMAISSTGTMYVADYYAIYQITPQGEMSVLAGSPGNYGYVGDGGPANGARFNQPHSLALDEKNNILYVADYYNYVVRQIDLTAGTINAFAGSNATTEVAPYGDGGNATAAYFGYPASIALDTKGLVYIIDQTHQKIRVVDPSLNTINTWISASSAVCNGADALYQLQPSSQILFDSTGGAYISGYSCGLATGSSYALGLMFRSSTGVLSRILGSNVVNTAENQPATSTSLPDLGGFALDSAGNIAISVYSNQRVRLITKATGKINTIVGNGTAGYATAADAFSPPGDYEPATGVELNYPTQLAYAPGNHLVICDTNDYAVREIW